MADQRMATQMASKPGFIAALDQSGGSAPGVLKRYGISETVYSGNAEMFRLIHEMRCRIVTAPAFTGDRVIGAILFEGTMDGEVNGIPVPTYLWERRGVTPFVKVDKGLEPEQDGVRRMKPMPELDTLLDRAVRRGVYGTKMRSVIARASKSGIATVVDQQFDVANRIATTGLMPILEPEVLITAPDKPEAESILRDEILRRLDASPHSSQFVIKLNNSE